MKSAFVIVLLVGALLGGCDVDTSCTDDYDCAGENVCKISSGQCQPIVCKEDSDCDSGLVCDDNACVQPGA